MVDRHVAPAEDDLSFGTHGAFDFLLAGEARRAFLGQENHANAVVAGARQGDALRGHDFLEVVVRDLDQNPRTVTHQRIGSDCTAVVEILQNQQPLFDDRMALGAFDVRYKTDTAGVVLVGGVVQPLPLR